MHATWYADEVHNALGHTKSHNVLYESIEINGDWSVPAIVARPAQPSQPALASGEEGVLHMAWIQGQPSSVGLVYATQIQYDCESQELTGAAKAVHSVASSPATQDFPRLESPMMPILELATSGPGK